MKIILLKTLLLINLFVIYNCKAQTTSDYITFYNELVPKLNTVAANKAQFYGQNFSSFYNELLNKNISVVRFHCDYKIHPSTKYYVLDIFFEDSGMWSVASDSPFQYPWVSITFENEIPKQIKDMVLQTHGEWNNTFVQFFSNMKIEKIKFIGINGYDSNDWTEK